MLQDDAQVGRSSGFEFLRLPNDAYDRHFEVYDLLRLCRITEESACKDCKLNASSGSVDGHNLLNPKEVIEVERRESLRTP